MSKTSAKVVAINHAALVDRLGELNAQIAPIKDEIDGIKETLRASGFDVIEGQLFRCTVGKTIDKPYVDWETIASTGIKPKRLAELVAQFTAYKPALGAVRCVAKTRS